jgi:hypothetical protein
MQRLMNLNPTNGRHHVSSVARGMGHRMGATWCTQTVAIPADAFARTYKRPTRPPEPVHT